MQMTREGKETVEIRAFIDKKYSQYGPPTETDEKYSQYGPPTETEPVPAGQFSLAGPPLPGSEEARSGDMTHEGAIGSCGQAENSCQETSD